MDRTPGHQRCGGRRRVWHGSGPSPTEFAASPARVSATRGCAPGRALRPKRGIGGAQDVDALVQHVLFGEAAAAPVDIIDPSAALEISALLRSGEVVSAVVLVKRASPDDPKISARDEFAGSGRRTCCGSTGDAATDVKDAKHRLPGGLRAAVHEGEALRASLGAPPSMLSMMRLSSVTVHATAVEDESINTNEIQEAEIPSAGEQRLWRIRRGASRLRLRPWLGGTDAKRTRPGTSSGLMRRC